MTFFQGIMSLSCFYPQVHAIYQKCGTNITASCNCAVAVQSGDDVIVIDRCFRDVKPVKRLDGEFKDITQMKVNIFLNGQLTPGTSVYQQADGKIYLVSIFNYFIISCILIQNSHAKFGILTN